MRLRRPDDRGLVIVHDDVLAVFARHIQRRDHDLEAGGMLLGRVMVSGDVRIDEASQPTSADVRDRFRFFRAREPAQDRVDRAWSASKGTRVYLGEWHTHPEDVPTPSNTDLANWRRIAREVVSDAEIMLFAIVGLLETRLWETWRDDPADGIRPCLPLDRLS